MLKILRNNFINLTILSIISAILYNSWPLGHWLNPAVSENSLASGLEAVGQPYNWLFITGDISSSIIIIIVCYFLWRRFKSSKLLVPIELILGSFVLFGIGTIIDALLPERCVQGIQNCPSFTQDHLLLFHGIFSILASVFLFVGLFLIWLHQKKNITINGLLIGYIIFGIISLGQAIDNGKNGNWSQDYYITLCSVWLALIPYAIYRVAYKVE